MVTTSTIPVHPGNLEQLHAWDGEEGAYWAANADAFERGIAGFDPAFLDAAAIGRADRVLDIGCGTGSTSLAAARRAPAGAVLGVDLSAAMLAVARRNAEQQGLVNVEFLQGDAQIHPFARAAFDVAISRTAAMFFADRVAALSNIGRGLVPGGRLVLLVWQPPQRNEWFLELTGALAAGRQLPAPPPDAPHPFTLADPAVSRDVVTAAGYTDVTVDGVDGVMDLGPDPRGASDLMLGLLGWMLQGLDDDGRARAVDALRRTVEAHTGPDGVRFGAGVWLIRARRSVTAGT
jgi:SAM-dependent methyltransferase